MHKNLVIAGAIAALAVPAGAQAHGTNHDPGKPDAKAKANASRTCRAERGTTDATRAAFAAKYGTGKHHKNAFGKCVSQLAKAAQHS